MTLADSNGDASPARERDRSRRRLLGEAAAAASLALVGGRRTFAAEAAKRPAGTAPGLEPFDEMMAKFMTEHEVPGAALAVTRKGKLVYARGFGTRAAGRVEPVVPDTLFRIASLSKPFTAVAVLQLAERKGLDLDKPVLQCFPYQRMVRGKVADARWEKVTIRHCLHHLSGMDRGKSGDPIGMLGEIRKATGAAYPIPPEAVIGFALQRSLDAEPGERYAYSNVGYLILGRIIETASGKRYGDYIRDEVLKPLGIKSMQLGRALPENRPAAETAYFDRKNRTGPCIYPPKVVKPVPLADGAFNFEGYEAHGAWVASAIDLARFMAAFDDRKKCSLLSEKGIAAMYARPPKFPGDATPDGPVYYACGWQVRQVMGPSINAWHNGLLNPGTSTLMVRRRDRTNWAVLFNTDADADAEGKALANGIDGPLHAAADAVKAWPDVDLFPTYYG